MAPRHRQGMGLSGNGSHEYAQDKQKLEEPYTRFANVETHCGTFMYNHALSAAPMLAHSSAAS